MECGRHHWDGEPHAPAFEVVEEEFGFEEGVELRFRAISAEEAAEKWADHDDCASSEYDIVSGDSEPIVLVRDADGVITRWRVTGEAVPSYHATAIEEASS